MQKKSNGSREQGIQDPEFAVGLMLLIYEYEHPGKSRGAEKSVPDVLHSLGGRKQGPMPKARGIMRRSVATPLLGISQSCQIEPNAI